MMMGESAIAVERNMQHVSEFTEWPVCPYCGQNKQEYGASNHTVFFMGYCKDCWEVSAKDISYTCGQILRRIYDGDKIEFFPDNRHSKLDESNYSWLWEHGYLIVSNGFYDLSVRAKFYVAAKIIDNYSFKDDFNALCDLLHDADSYRVVSVISRLLDKLRAKENDDE
jgi:hypothetical protein